MSNKKRVDSHAAFVEWRMDGLSWGAAPFKDALRRLCEVVAASPDPERGYDDLATILIEGSIITEKAERDTYVQVEKEVRKPYSKAGMETQKKLKERKMDDYGTAAILVGNDFIEASKEKPPKVAIAKAIEEHFRKRKGKLPDRPVLMRNINTWISSGELKYPK
jgi:hypothetical protein